MVRAVVQITLFGLLLASSTTLPNKDNWDIYSFHINSTVTSRYAITVITSRVVNRMDESKEIEFHVRIPKNAFISKFKMHIEGQDYDGVVKPKEQAQQQYSEAVSRGQSAGIVSSVGRTLEEFKTSVTVAAQKKVTFELTYEELLRRRHGKYELQIHARPMQPVKDFKVDVNINEKAGIKFVEVKGGLSTKALANAISKTQTDKQAWVYFYPSEDQQKTCDSCGPQGMNGDLVILYDVNRDASLGDIKTSAGYFVHHFAPSRLSPIPKNVVFVIDQSGSMHGKKIQQTRIALLHILNDLTEDDYFGLITFDSGIFHWKRELVQASKTNLDSAKTFARNIEANGATDINGAVTEGAKMLNAHPRAGSASILILLTDGDPTAGVTNLEVIQSNVRRVIAEKFPLYCLGFGFDVNFEFLEKMALQNNGAARRIYEDSDADLQLKGFYEEVATPLLTDVTMVYEGGTNLTQTNFSQYYNGSEIVVAGQITDNDIETFNPQVVAISRNTRMVFSDPKATVESTGTVPDTHVQRVWAYLTVKQLLEKQLQLSGPEKENVKKEALRLSLKYSFVTPLTSMVVTKPLGEDTDVLHKPKEGQSSQGTRLSFHKHLLTQSSASSLRPLGRPAASRPSKRLHDMQGTPVRGVGGERGFAGVDYFLRGRAGNYGGGGGGGGASFIHRSVAMPPPPPPPAVFQDIRDYDIDYVVQTAFPKRVSIRPTMMPTAPGRKSQVPGFYRFLLKGENQSLPICFDVPSGAHLDLLGHRKMGISLTGQLSSTVALGFSSIYMAFPNNGSITADQTGVNIYYSGAQTRYTGNNHITVGSATVIMRLAEIEIITANIRIVILIHGQYSGKFLWPVIRQQPSDGSLTGLLAVKPGVYEEVQQGQTTVLKMNNKEIPVTRSSAVDYSIQSSPTLECWLMSAESALQAPLARFSRF